MVQIDKIDLTNLDDVLARHPYEFQQETEDLPNLKRDVGIKKLELERVKASLYLHTRARLTDSGEKFTESKLSGMVDTSEEYLTASRNYLDAKLAVDKVEQKKEFMMQRESSLKILAHLYVAQYWSLHGLDKETTPRHLQKRDRNGK